MTYTHPIDQFFENRDDPPSGTKIRRQDLGRSCTLHHDRSLPFYTVLIRFGPACFPYRGIVTAGSSSSTRAKSQPEYNVTSVEAAASTSDLTTPRRERGQRSAEQAPCLDNVHSDRVPLGKLPWVTVPLDNVPFGQKMLERHQNRSCIYRACFFEEYLNF